eukprot:3679701-Prymnesium_polylepis.1
MASSATNRGGSCAPVLPSADSRISRGLDRSGHAGVICLSLATPVLIRSIHLHASCSRLII